MNMELYEDEKIHSSDLNIVAAFKNLLPFLRTHKKRPCISAWVLWSLHIIRLFQ